MLGDSGDKNMSQVCPCPRETQKLIGETDIEGDKGIEGQLEVILYKFVSQHMRDSPWV